MNYDWYIIRGADGKPLRKQRPVDTNALLRRMLREQMKLARKTVKALATRHQRGRTRDEVRKKAATTLPFTLAHEHHHLCSRRPCNEKAVCSGRCRLHRLHPASGRVLGSMVTKSRDL